ncbi:hypothetical protein LAZ67_19002676 [Cordylochernes scorpioides]|uniref:Transposase n=1 Tax=Cordylochernes scorpioides TaxID=51811 RepID=A0ABY6LIQ7_9ARAC|nr:hypothetical protein LAZ67_19002676 [Cordylochernes scorpioides]
MERKLKQRICIEFYLKLAEFPLKMIFVKDAQKFQRTDENVQKITDLIKENPRTTLLELEQDTGISKTTIGRIDMLEMTRTDPEWKDKIITGYETWVYGYDLETKHQSAEWRCQGKRFEKKRPEKWTNGGWILHHDNARPHTAHLMTSFLAKNGTQILLQPPYFPDIAPNDFFLFPKLKAVLKRIHFDTRDDIIEKSPLALKSIPKEAYKNCFDNWEKRWRCLTDAYEETWTHPDSEETIAEFECSPRPLLDAECGQLGLLLHQLGPFLLLLLLEECSRQFLHRITWHLWLREFKNSRTDVHDEPRAVLPSVSDETIAKVEAAMLEDRRVTVRKLCDLVPDVSKTTIDKISREHLGYSKVCAIWVPKMLTEDHKRQRVDAAQKFLDCHKTDGEEFLDSIVTGDVTWVHYTTPETKEKSKQWNHISSPKPLKFKQTLSAGKLMATVFWNRKGLLLCDFMRRGTTINSDRYCETLKQLRCAIQNKRRGMLTKGVRFHHDNARPHTANQTTALIEEFEWELLSHPPYSPDVAPSDFHFFPELKKNLGGTQFQDDDELEEAVLGFLRG